jgi:hypothetical protein
MLTDWWLLLLLLVVVVLLLLLLLGADITDACKARVAAGDSAGGDIVAVASSLVAEMRQRVFEATKLTASAGAGCPLVCELVHGLRHSHCTSDSCSCWWWCGAGWVGWGTAILCLDTNTGALQQCS